MLGNLISGSPHHIARSNRKSSDSIPSKNTQVNRWSSSAIAFQGALQRDAPSRPFSFGWQAGSPFWFDGLCDEQRTVIGDDDAVFVDDYLPSGLRAI